MSGKPIPGDAIFRSVALVTLTRLCVTALSVTSLTSCGNETSATPVTSEIDGHWETGCVSTGDGKHAVNTLRIANGEATFSSQIATDPACAQQETVNVVTYRFSTGSTVSNPAGAKKFDGTLAEALIEPQTSAIADEYNATKLCGYDDWAQGQSKDITTCNRYETSYLNVYKLSSDASPDTLQFGDCYTDNTNMDCTSDSRRPQSLEGKTYQKI